MKANSLTGGLGEVVDKLEDLGLWRKWAEAVAEAEGVDIRLGAFTVTDDNRAYMIALNILEEHEAKNDVSVD